MLLRLYYKMIYKAAQHAWRNTKNFFGHAYLHGKRLLRDIDYGVDITRRILQTAAPVIRDLGGGSELGRAHRALGDYETMKARVLGADRTGQHLLGGLRTRVPELGL